MARIKIQHNVVVLQKFPGAVCRHDYLPRCGIICNYIHRGIHHRLQSAVLVRAGLQFGQAPVVDIGIKQRHPTVSRKFERQRPFHRALYDVDGCIIEKRLRPLFAPSHRTFREGIVRQVFSDFMENRCRMLREKIAERNPLVIRPNLHIEPVVALILAAHMQSRRIEPVAHGAPLAIKRMPHAVDRRIHRHTVNCQQIHPALGLLKVALSKRHLPNSVVNL